MTENVYIAEDGYPLDAPCMVPLPMSFLQLLW